MIVLNCFSGIDREYGENNEGKKAWKNPYYVCQSDKILNKLL